MQDEDSGIGFGTVAAAGAGIAGLVFRRNIGKFAKDYIKEFNRVTDPDALLIKKNKAEEVAKFDQEYGGRTFGSEILEQDKGIASIKASKELVPVDKVDDITAAKPLTQGQLAQKEAQATLQKENQFLYDLKKSVAQQPLTLGGGAFAGDLYGVGSTLFDSVVTLSQTAKPMPVSHWEKLFKSRMSTKADFIPLNRANPKAQSIVTMDEIADANLAKYDKKGNLIDGYLKYIKDINKESSKDNQIRISPLTILSLIKNAPANNLKVTEYTSDFFKKDAETLNSFTESIFKGLAGTQEGNLQKLNLEDLDTLVNTKLLNLDINNASKYRKLQEVKNELEQAKGSASLISSQGLKKGTSNTSIYGNPFTGALKPIQRLKEMIDGLGGRVADGIEDVDGQRLNSFLDKPVSSLNYKGAYEIKDPNQTIRQAIKELQTKTEDSGILLSKMLTNRTDADVINLRKSVFDLSKSYKEVSKLKNKIPYNEYPDYETYRIMGTENFFESLITVDKRLMDDVRKTVPSFRAEPARSGHFFKDIFGKSNEGQILHIRGGTRQVDGGGTALSIDEMQSDINQAVMKAIKAMKAQMLDGRFRAEMQAIRNNPENYRKFKKEVADFRKTKFKSYAMQNLSMGDEYIRTMSDDISASRMEAYYEGYKKRNLTAKDKNDLITKPSSNPEIGSKFLFGEAAENAIRNNKFNLDAIGTDLYRDRLLTISDEMSALTAKGVGMTRKDLDQIKKLQIKYEEIKELIPTINTRPSSTHPYLPFAKKEQWGALGIKYAIRKAAKEDLDWVTINPYEVVHHKDQARLGNLEFYGNKRGAGDISKRVAGKINEKEMKTVERIMGSKYDNKPGYQDVIQKEYLELLSKMQRKVTKGRKNFASLNTRDGPKKADSSGATIPNFMRKFAEDYGTEVKTIRVAKSDPSKVIKITKPRKAINADTGEEEDFIEHIAAFTEDEYEALKKIGDIPTYYKGDDIEVVTRKPKKYYREDYYESFAIKVKPEFKDIPIKGYVKGGLAQNIFKW